MELQRMYIVTPVTGPRRVTRDTILHGYNIPKVSNTPGIGLYSAVWREVPTHQRKLGASNFGIFWPENGRSSFLQNVYNYVPQYMTTHTNP
jgi:hypothetical protein